MRKASNLKRCGGNRDRQTETERTKKSCEKMHTPCDSAAWTWQVHRPALCVWWPRRDNSWCPHFPRPRQSQHWQHCPPAAEWSPHRTCCTLWFPPSSQAPTPHHPGPRRAGVWCTSVWLAKRRGHILCEVPTTQSMTFGNSHAWIKMFPVKQETKPFPNHRCQSATAAVTIYWAHHTVTIYWAQYITQYIIVTIYWAQYIIQSPFTGHSTSYSHQSPSSIKPMCQAMDKV